MGLILTVFVFRLHKPVSAYAISTLIRGVPSQPDSKTCAEDIKENAQSGLLNLRPFTRCFICCLISV